MKSIDILFQKLGNKNLLRCMEDWQLRAFMENFYAQFVPLS